MFTHFLVYAYMDYVYTKQCTQAHISHVQTTHVQSTTLRIYLDM